MKFNFAYLLLHLFILTCTHISAQVTLRGELSSFPERELKNSNGSFSFHRVSLGASTPVYKKLNMEKRTFNAVILSVNSAYNNVYYSTLPQRLQNLSISSGVSFLHYNGMKNIWLGSITPFLSAPTQSFTHTIPGVVALGIYQRRVNEKWSYNAGALFISARQQILLPLLGFHYRFDEKEQLQFNLPFNAAYIVQSTPKSKHKLSIGFKGFISQTPFTTADGYLRVQQLLMQYTYKRRVNESFIWHASAGLAGGRKVVLYNTPFGDINEPIKGGLNLEAGISYTFRKKTKQVELPDTDLFNLDELSLDELEDELGDE
ncbi:MAG: hypothetical protein KBB37_01565 [Bacteroidia bacterium]|nr:hypothetical protein [Bacteroidia bacterium]MBP7259946.1 hypothetical protein [Bacteroidia bacterium]MBP9179426.1 hypothetical protein [Bacteroidia bacterium]MBP9723705.1 hypothetical protein [Bacteroidia bacterium]